MQDCSSGKSVNSKLLLLRRYGLRFLVTSSRCQAKSKFLLILLSSNKMKEDLVTCAFSTYNCSETVENAINGATSERTAGVADRTQSQAEANCSGKKHQRYTQAERTLVYRLWMWPQGVIGPQMWTELRGSPADTS